MKTHPKSLFSFSRETEAEYAVYSLKSIEERVVLIGVQTSEDEDVAVSLDELEELAETAGAVTVAKVIQNREAVHPGYLYRQG